MTPWGAVPSLSPVLLCNPSPLYACSLKANFQICNRIFTSITTTPRKRRDRCYDKSQMSIFNDGAANCCGPTSCQLQASSWNVHSTASIYPGCFHIPENFRIAFLCPVKQPCMSFERASGELSESLLLLHLLRCHVLCSFSLYQHLTHHEVYRIAYDLHEGSP